MAADRKADMPIFQTRVGTMFCDLFSSDPGNDYASAKTADTARFGRFFQAMLERGIYLAPSQFEAGFMSLAHSDEDIERTVDAAAEAFRLSL
jgi:glutamate-1-semialdehyde 2,1-aminomutase